MTIHWGFLGWPTVWVQIDNPLFLPSLSRVDKGQTCSCVCVWMCVCVYTYRRNVRMCTYGRACVRAWRRLLHPFAGIKWKRINLENVPLKPRKGSQCDLICCYWLSRWVFSCSRGVHSKNNLPGVIWAKWVRGERSPHLLSSSHLNHVERCCLLFLGDDGIKLEEKKKEKNSTFLFAGI